MRMHNDSGIAIGLSLIAEKRGQSWLRMCFAKNRNIILLPRNFIFQSLEKFAGAVGIEKMGKIFDFGIRKVESYFFFGEQ